jgi:hypothetical protein
MLGGYSALEGPSREGSIANAMQDPAVYAGRELTLPANTRVLQVSPQGIRVAQRGLQIAVRVPEGMDEQWQALRGELQAGDYVSLKAIFRPEGYLVLREMHIHTGRHLKIWVSILALLLFAGIIIRERRR